MSGWTDQKIIVMLKFNIIITVDIVGPEFTRYIKVMNIEHAKILFLLFRSPAIHLHACALHENLQIFQPAKGAHPVPVQARDVTRTPSGRGLL